MATINKKKKIVTKEDLRRLMKEKQSVIKSCSQKIEHPLAKYNSLDQLVCLLCNTVIKTTLLWTAHLQSRQHKEKIEDLKKVQIPEATGLKRKANDISDTHSKKKLQVSSHENTSGKSLPSDFFDKSKGQISEIKPKSILVNSTKQLLNQYSSDSQSDTDDDAVETVTTNNGKPLSLGPTKSSMSGLPPDFFDVGVTPSTSKVANEAPSKAVAMADVLPEGFFDDPKLDAKVRKVEYVDKMDEEWELFQKSMKEETHVSEAIIDEEDEQVNVDRNIDEIEEQMQCWKEVNDLENKKEEIMKKVTTDTKKDKGSDDDLNEDDLEEFLDWRSKKSWR